MLTSVATADQRDMSLLQNGNSASDITIYDEPQEFQLQADVSLGSACNQDRQAEAPVRDAEEAPSVSAPDAERIPAMQGNGAKKELLDALEKSLNDWMKDYSKLVIC